MVKFNFKKILATVGAATVILTIPGTLVANAYGKTTGHLNVSYHYVPILKDKATGSTCTNYSTSKKSNTDKLWVQTTVRAYDKNGNCVTKTGRKCYGTAALEGWNSTNATAEIRNMTKAKGTHKGGTTGYGSTTAYTSWSK